MNPQIILLLNQSLEFLRDSNLESAELCLKQIISLESSNPYALRLLGVISAQRGRYPEALNYLKASLKALPQDSLTLSNLGNVYLEIKEYSNALDAYDKAIKINPKYEEAWSNKGNVLNELKRYDEAIAHYDQALSLKPNYAEAWSNKGNVLNELKRYNEAIAHYDQALILKPDYAEAWTNKGWTLYELKRYDEAIAHYDQALSLKPDYVETWSNKGTALNDLKRYEEAITHYNQALILKPDYAQGWSNKGATLNDLKRYDEAIAHYDQALILKPDIDWVYGYLLHAKMKIASWSNLASDIKNIAKKVIAKERVAGPFILAMNDDALLHKQAAQIFAQEKYPSNPTLDPIYKLTKKEKIRIAYFSPDFQSHPVSFLTSELFEIHSRDKFEVFAFSLQKAPIGDRTNVRLRKGFDSFIDVDNLSDHEIAQLARELEIDIAIDLAGPTQYSRTGIFSYRASPIQVNWLGYPGTIGADFIDYIVADKTLIPESHQEFYSEKVVCLPDTYMVDDSKRVASSRIFTREECGLPQNAFVFCCFNNDYKFNPQVLDSWSRILHGVENSVLWVSENNQAFKTNITAEFESRGIDSSRIIFAKRVELMSDHLARYAIGDLFLDTYPYNAHTTAVDSLKACTPILTLMGQSFASRVAASLLNAIGLHELITTTQEDYEALAIELAQNPQKLAHIKQKIRENRLTAPLFDTPLFTKNLEAAYIQMYERYHADLEPDHIAL